MTEKHRGHKQASSMSIRHFITLLDYSKEELKQLIVRATALKAELRGGKRADIFKNKVLGMIFEKSSTRTRVSFESAMSQCGGSAIFLSPRDTQLGRGEPIEDTARVLSSMVDALIVRTYQHEKIQTFAKYATVPVINALTDDFHPCQLLADMQTYFEIRGDIQGKKVVWIGDGNNMCQSYMNAAHQFDFELIISCPSEFKPSEKLLQKYSDHISIENDPAIGIKSADLVVTDVWASMGQEEEQKKREESFANYQVTPKLMDLADKDVLFMHCLPAHRGEEVSEDMLTDPRSVVWAEAENRLHAQKALLEDLLSESNLHQ